MRETRLIVPAICAVLVTSLPHSVPDASWRASEPGQLEPSGLRPLTIDTLLEIRHPSNPIWSPDGRHIAFVWDRAGTSAWYVVAAERPTGGAAATPRAIATGAGLVALAWNPDGRSLRFQRNGETWRVSIDGSEPMREPERVPEPRRVPPGPEAEPPSDSAVPSPDGARVAFVKSRSDAGEDGAELWVRARADDGEARVAAEKSSIRGVSWSPDSKTIVYTVGTKSIRHDQTPAYSGAKIIYTITENVPGQSYAVPAAGGPKVPLPPGGIGPRRWLDGRRYVVDRVGTDFKRRTIAVVNIADGQPTVLETVLQDEIEPKFWSLPADAGGLAQPSPDGKWVAFLSDRDGWDHLYVVSSRGGRAVQITKGRFEAWRPAWSPDSTRIAFDANDPDHPGDRHLGIVAFNVNSDHTTDAAHATVTMLTAGRGTDIAPRWSPDGKRLLYQHTDARNSADLYVIDVPPSNPPSRDPSAARTVPPRPTRLTDSLPPEIDRRALVEPQLVRYAGPDGQPVPAWLFTPPALDRSKKHPAIVWVHGDGINQNYDGWHVQRNYAVYYSFHQYLLQRGYVVIAPDYRGSIGYGRDWRTGVYMDVGGNDAKDAWMAAGYLATLSYVDPARIGIWGLSYGGFFTLIAVTDQPALYRAAVDVAGVADYRMYYEDPFHGGWTVSRIGTPEQHPEIYAQASPISHVDRLARPLLILHGTADVNVPYLHSVRLIDELMRKGKGDLVSFMMYPGEFHYFTRAHVLRDAWSRVEAFFDSQLY